MTDSSHTDNLPSLPTFPKPIFIKSSNAIFPEAPRGSTSKSGFRYSGSRERYIEIDQSQPQKSEIINDQTKENDLREARGSKGLSTTNISRQSRTSISLSRSYSTFQGQKALVNSMSRKQSIGQSLLDMNVGREAVTDEFQGTEFEKPTILIYPRKSVMTKSMNSISNGLSKVVSTSESSVQYLASQQNIVMSTSMSSTKLLSKDPIENFSQKFNENALFQLVSDDDKSGSLTDTPVSNQNSSRPVSGLGEIDAGYQNNADYYDYLMLCQRHASNNFIHKIASSDVVWQEKELKVKMIGPYLLGSQIGKGMNIRLFNKISPKC
ncbi:hypothetical protein HK096_000470 [Nowakowskiella sp. JEL0078]|nr:hypothetical protein HK096_000470 [Nowakowskiella sp. JEL0078]